MVNDEITIIVPICFKPETRAAGRERLLALARKTRLEAGNLMYRIHEVPDDENLYMIYEKWQDQAALDFHMNQDYLTSFLADSDGLMAGEVKGTICREIDDVN